MDPVTIMMIAAGMKAFGKLLGGITAYTGAQKQSKALEAGAAQARQEAGIQAGLDIAEGDRVAGHAAVQAAANGGGFTGSTMGVLRDLAAQSMFKARASAYAGEAEGRAKMYQAKVTRRNGEMALLSATIEAGSSALSMMGQGGGGAGAAAGASAGAGASGAAAASSSATAAAGPGFY